MCIVNAYSSVRRLLCTSVLVCVSSWVRLFFCMCVLWAPILEYVCYCVVCSVYACSWVRLFLYICLFLCICMFLCSVFCVLLFVCSLLLCVSVCTFMPVLEYVRSRVRMFSVECTVNAYSCVRLLLCTSVIVNVCYCVHVCSCIRLLLYTYVLVYVRSCVFLFLCISDHKSICSCVVCIVYVRPCVRVCLCVYFCESCRVL